MTSLDQIGTAEAGQIDRCDQAQRGEKEVVSALIEEEQMELPGERGGELCQDERPDRQIQAGS